MNSESGMGEEEVVVDDEMDDDAGGKGMRGFSCWKGVGGVGSGEEWRGEESSNR